ncbi:unnamed protein product [Brugia pahangi]|uniref:Uncharacterized protein n=1 Tax=Brugia pahangi TaxID=6280 RepID=A0A0N4SX42_BRUPA|nr:unnamed protein product [Brugia pahangi]
MLARETSVDRSEKWLTEPALELDENLLSVKQELMPLNELPCSDEEASISSAFSTATTITSGPSIVTSTNVSTEGMSSGEAIPYLSIGPYHQRPAPILTDNAFVGDQRNVMAILKDDREIGQLVRLVQLSLIRDLVFRDFFRLTLISDEKRNSQPPSQNINLTFSGLFVTVLTVVSLISYQCPNHISKQHDAKKIGDAERSYPCCLLTVQREEQKPDSVIMYLIGFLNISPPNCPSPSASTEMRGPPPQRDPPIPPLIQDEASTAYVVDDSQYDEPGIPQKMKEYCKASASRRHSKLLNNNYEISASQQIRTAFVPSTRNSRLGQREREPGPSWDDETRQMLLQNPETGSYYIPTSSGKLLS